VPENQSEKTSQVVAGNRDPNDRSHYGIPALLLALGLGSVAMLIGANWIRERLITEDIVYVRAAGEVQTRAAIAHLWVEELVTGDNVNPAEIWENIDRAQELLALIAGARDAAPLATRLLFDSEQTDEFELHSASARELFDRFETVSRERESGYASGLNVGIGSPFDVEYDALFAGLLAHLRSLENILKERLAHAERRASTIFRAMLVVWVLLVALAVVGIANHERKRREAQRALRESQAQLLQAQKMEAVGRLAGGIAHDINNHLAAITAQCELVKLAADPEDPVVPKMDAAINTATKSATLIKRLLAFSRRQPVVLQVVQVNKVLGGLESMLSRLIGEEIRLETRLTPDLWNITIDPSQLEQILLNLVVNARDAMPRGGSVRITTVNKTLSAAPARNGNGRANGNGNGNGHGHVNGHGHANGNGHAGGNGNVPRDYVVISVADTGTGIPPEIRDKIFEPFYTTKERGQGSGLGLATIDGIVRQNGGYIALESKIDEGSTFRIFLPRTFDDAGVQSDEVESEDLKVAQHDAGILLVEDNEELRESTYEILERLGYSIFTASHGDEALQLFLSHGDEIDMVVSDVIMPGMDGKQLADRLRQERPHLPILFVSGYTDEVVLDRGIDEHEFDFLAKPFSAASLVDKVELLLGSRAERTAS